MSWFTSNHAVHGIQVTSKLSANTFVPQFLSEVVMTFMQCEPNKIYGNLISYDAYLLQNRQHIVILHFFSFFFVCKTYVRALSMLYLEAS